MLIVVAIVDRLKELPGILPLYALIARRRRRATCRELLWLMEAEAGTMCQYKGLWPFLLVNANDWISGVVLISNIDSSLQDEIIMGREC